MARNGNMYDKTIQSNYLKEEMIVKIYEPERFDSLYETNVCIMQDGDDYFQLGRVATVSDKLHDEFDIVNAFFVGIHYIDRFDRLKKYHPSGEQYAAYKKFLAKEVVPLIDQLVPINPLGMKRTLIGDSLAGTIALMTAMDYPELFHKVLIQSPLVNETVLQEATTIEGLEIYHSIGLDEENVKTSYGDIVDFVTPNKQLQATLQKKIATYHYKEIETGKHTWKQWQKELPHALSLLLN